MQTNHMVRLNDEDTVTEVVCSDRLSYWYCSTLWDQYSSGTTRHSQPNGVKPKTSAI